MKRKWTHDEVQQYYKKEHNIVYYNKEDGNLFVQIDTDLGFKVTVNYANPKAYIILSILILFIIFAITIK